MKVKLIGRLETVMSNPCSRHNYFAWPTVALLQNGTVAVSASGFRLGHICPFGKAVIAYSSDLSKTYTVPAPVIDTPLDDRDAGLCTFDKGGVIITSFNNTAQMQREHNKGNEYIQSYVNTITPEDEKNFLGSTFRISHDCAVTFGPIYRSPVTSPHGPVQLSSGEVLWAGNSLENFEGGIEIHRINTDNGSTEFVGKITHDSKAVLCEPHMIELPDGKLICHIRGEGEGIFTVYQSISSDKGRTWSTPEMLLDETGGAPPHLLLLSSGVLLCVYSRRKQPFGIMAMLSLDSGQSWEKDIRLYENTFSDDLGYPSTVELPDKTLLSVFYAKSAPDSPCVIMQQRWKIEH